MFQMETETIALNESLYNTIYIGISDGDYFMENSCYSIESMWDEEKKIFLNKALVKVSYVPTNISDALHREDVIKKMQRCLIDISKNLAPNNIIVYGKMGTGKTMITKLVLNDLERVAAKKRVKLTTIYISCEDANSENGVLGLINNNLMFELLGKFREKIGNSISRNTFNFKKLFNELDGILIIVLDEIDKIKNPDLINKLTRSISEKTGQPPCLICITNNINFKDDLKGHTKSVLAESEIQFNPYNAEQLNNILDARVEKAFYTGVVVDMVVPLISALCAQENGDARKAINLLCKSGEIAEEKLKNVIKEEDVREANDRLELDRLTSIIETLPTQSKLTLLTASVLSENSPKNECTTGEIYNVYKQYAHLIDIDILTQRRITDLISELDSLGIINAIVKSNGRYGKTKVISMQGSKQIIRHVLLQNYRLKSLEGNFLQNCFRNNFK
jgi:cell division control protein 6